MIKIEFTFSDNDIILQIDGHAEYNKGNDIVCAGVSAIAYNLASYLQVQEIPFTFKDNPGDFLCGVKKSEIETIDVNRELEDIKTFFEYSYIGLFQIERLYPNNVSVKINDIGRK